MFSATPASGLELPPLAIDPYAHAPDQILVRFHDDAQVVVLGQRLMQSTNVWRIDLDGHVSVEHALAAFRGRSDVVYAQPDYRVSAQEWYETSPPNPSDAFYQNSMLWGLNNTGAYEGIAGVDIDAATAWPVSRGGGVTVAVIDTGVDYTHPDLAANMWTNAGDPIGDSNGDGNHDDDGNGYVDDYYGYDFANNDSNPMDDQGHGTHVAGTIAATANNDTGGPSSNTGLAIIGVAPEARIMALKFLDASGYGTTSNAIRALDYALSMGVKISNNSYGGAPFEQIMLDAINRAADAGHLFVAAAGNGNWLGIGQNNDSTPYYPASYVPQGGRPDTVITVAASNSSDGYGGFSNYGATSVDLAAPGVHIWSTIPLAKDTVDGSPEGYTRKDGTSMAAPHVAGAAALVWSTNPGLSALDVKELLLSNVDPISGRDTLTDGRLNVGRAVAAARPPGPGIRVTPTSGLVTTETGGTASFTVRLETQPTADVTIPVSSGNTGEGAVSTSSLTFTADNWNVPQTVTITGVDDTVVDGNIAYTIVLGAATSDDVRYSGLEPADVSVTNTDDDVPPTKFYVVNDATANQTYEYGATGLIESYTLNSGNTAPRGAAISTTGDTLWVVDANKRVYVYNGSGELQGSSWTAGSLASSASVEGVAVSGTDVWIVDAKQDRIYRYAGGANRHLTGGTLNASSSFSLNSGNRNPKDVVTDGVHLWVVNNNSTDKVFKYTLAGALVGSWTITSGGGSPTGITIDPTNGSDIWIVDSASDNVYRFIGGMVQPNNTSKSPDAFFALTAGNANAQGIAAPPTLSGASLMAGASSSARSHDSLAASFDTALLALTEELADALDGGKKKK